MRKALIVGVDHYAHLRALTGCVNDAYSVKAMLERHADGTVNFTNPRVVTGADTDELVERRLLREQIRELFSGSPDVALFYFAGHGHVDSTGGFLCLGDSADGDDGLSLTEIVALAANSSAKNRIIILDSCHGGVAGNRADSTATAEIKEGMTILTASTATQAAMEVQGGGAGVFTNLLVDALNGAAANLVGDVTPGSIYAHIDQSLGPWGQRPVFKTNVTSFVSLRKAMPPIPLEDLQALASLFPTASHQLALDPSFEPERGSTADPSIAPPDPAKTPVFARLQRLARVNLVRPVGAPHMWHAAMQSRACELTALGQHYRRLVATGML